MKYHALFVIFENAAKFDVVVCCKLYGALYGLFISLFSRVDMLITNNCSCYPGLKLTLADPSVYRSLVMLNPAGIRPSR